MSQENWTENFKHGDHALHLFADDGDQLRAIGDLLGWLDRDESMVLMKEATPDWIKGAEPGARERLQEAIRSDKLHILSSRSFYYPENSFSLKAVFRSWENVLEQMNDLGFKRILAIGDIGWISAHNDLFDRFLGYEAQALVRGLPEGITALCQYDKRAFSTSQMAKLRNVHELEMEDGNLSRNFWKLAYHQR